MASSNRRSGTSKQQQYKPKSMKQQQPPKQKEKEEREVYPIHAYLKSPETARTYTFHFNRFLRYLEVKEDKELLQFDPKELESKIIKYLCDHMSVENQLKKNTVETAMSSIFSFCTMNDIFINKRKIAKLIPPDESHKDDRSYSREEIAELLRQSTDERFRAVILLLSNGLRVGSLAELQLQDLIPKSIGPNGEILDNDSGTEKLYQIWAYNRSASHRYYMFCTPECRKAIDTYLASRIDKGENLEIKTSPLFREQFNKGDRRKPKKLSVQSFKKNIERTINRARLGTKGSVMATHGLRKHAITQMIKAKVDYEVREYVSGHRHSRGLDTSYDRLTPDERLAEWSKAINLLTIDKSLHLEKKLQVLEGEQAHKFAHQEQEIIRLRKEKAADKAFLTEQINRMRKEFLDNQDRMVQSMVEAGDKYDALLKVRKKNKSKSD